MNILPYLLALPLIFHDYTREPEELDQWMTVQEQRQIGIDKLTNDQKHLFIRWIKSSFDKKFKKIGTTPFYIKKNIKDKNMLELSDGSIWEINPNDSLHTSHWKTESKVRISISNNEQYPFLIILASNEDCVEAKLNSKALLINKEDDSSEIIWLTQTIDNNGKIKVSDDSYWLTNSEDRDIISQWLIGDAIKIYNTKNNKSQYILHNTNTDQKINAFKQIQING